MAETGVVYDPQTALVVVDLQNDFADPDGSLSVRGGDEVVPVANREVERALEAGSPVFYTQDWHPPDTPHFETHGGPWPVHCVRETWGAQLHPDLKVAGEQIHKALGPEDGYSGFTVMHPSGETSSTGLAEALHARGVRRVVIVGLTTDYCVKDSTLDALALGFDVVVVTKGVRAVDVHPGDGERALEEIEAAGAVLV